MTDELYENDAEPVVLSIEDLAQETGTTVESWALPAGSEVVITPRGYIHTYSGDPGHQDNAVHVSDLAAGNPAMQAEARRILAERQER